MNYLDSGFDQYLLRPLEASYTEKIGIDSTSSSGQISGSQIKDKITSINGSFEIDLQKDRFAVKDGIINRIELGRLSDGSIGILIRDSDGNELIKFTESVNLMKSSNGAFEVNFTNEQIIVRDAGLTPRVLIGKQTNGF